MVKPGTTLELLAGARPPKQFAARTAGAIVDSTAVLCEV